MPFPPSVHLVQRGSVGEVLIGIEASDSDDARGGTIRLTLNSARLLAPQLEAAVARYLAEQRAA